jgi:hypothetical protein
MLEKGRELWPFIFRSHQDLWVWEAT